MDSNQDKLKEMLKEILDEKLEEKLAPLIQSIEFMSGKFDELKIKTSELEESSKILRKENEHLQQEFANLKNELKQQAIVIDNQEQYSRRECLEIRGTPVTPNENTSEIVQKIGKLINVEISKADISISHRIPGRVQRRGENMSTPPAIITKFTSRETRDSLYRARNKLKNHTTTDLGLGREATNPIYISESLTQRNKEIFKMALKFKKERRYRYIWTSAGRIFIRKDDNSPPKQISSLDDLKKLGQHVQESSVNNYG